jgi:hypothetical protein
MNFGRVTNAQIVERLDSLIAQSNERHAENKETLGDIRAEVRTTNGRLRSAESAIAVHWWAISLIGAALLALFAALLAKVFA